jgi:hypothetical protein
MWLRTLGACVAAAGLLIAGYLAWACYRISDEAMSDTHWPRPWPYPDQWLVRWLRQMAADPAKSGWTIGVARRHLAEWAGAGLVVGAGGLAPLAVWCRRRSIGRWPTGQAADYADGLSAGGRPAAAADDRGVTDAGGETV